MHLPTTSPLHRFANLNIPISHDIVVGEKSFAHKKKKAFSSFPEPVGVI